MKRVLIIGVILVILASGGFFVQKKLSAAGPADKTQFKIAKAEIGLVKKTVSATGTLQPWKIVDIKSKAGGRVMKMGVDVGSIVKTGQLIAQIDKADTQLQVDQAEADIKSAESKQEGSK